MATVRFHYASIKPVSLKQKRSLQLFVATIFELEGRELRRLDYIFCSDQYLLKINQSFLQHDYLTDIITFPLSNGEETIGEVYISVDRVRDNSRTYSTTFTSELLRVIFHGALHLIGYKDKKKSEITLMREKEDYYLRLFGAK